MAFMNAFLRDNSDFVSYGTEHIAVLVFFSIFGFLLIYYGRKQSEKIQRNLAFIFSLIILLSQISKLYFKWYLGVFSPAEHLPLHLCNMMPFVVPFIMYYRQQKMFSILFFWIMAGTLQAMFTPTLFESLPHFEAFRYWIVHAGLPILMIYGVIVYGFRLKFKDILWSLFYLNVVTAIIYPINLITGGNYLYIMEKPPGPTMFDIMGPWPWYILTCEFIFLILGSILYVPFYFINRREKETSLT